MTFAALVPGKQRLYWDRALRQTLLSRCWHILLLLSGFPLSQNGYRWVLLCSFLHMTLS